MEVVLTMWWPSSCYRTVTQSWMKRQLAANPKWLFFMTEVEKNAWKITFLSRLLPFPFGFINGLFAVHPPAPPVPIHALAGLLMALLRLCVQLSSVSYPVFLVGSFLGLLPFQLMWTYFGTTLYVACVAPFFFVDSHFRPGEVSGKL